MEDTTKFTDQQAFATMVTRLPKSLIDVCESSIAFNDLAHQHKHIERVINYGMELCDHFAVDSRVRLMVLTGCLMHDLGCRYDRKTHHFISYGMTFELLRCHAPDLFNAEETKLVALSCLEHRASYKGSHSSKISELVALADRGPLDYNELIDRCVQFNLKKKDTTPAYVLDYAVRHLEDKCGMDGYMWESYPAIGWELNGDRIEVIKHLVSSEQLKHDIQVSIDKHIAKGNK